MSKNHFFLSLLFCTSFLVSCNDNNEVTPQKESGLDYTEVSASLVSDPTKLDMLHSIKNVCDGRFFYLDYTADYMLDLVTQSNLTTTQGLIGFVLKKLCATDTQPANASISYGAGCSAFAVKTPEGDCIMGRNFDYSHGNEPIAAAMIRTSPANGLKSLALVDGYWIGYRQDLYHCFTEDIETFNQNKKQDLSYIMGFPYLLMDGMNEAGFSICVLHLDGKATQQSSGANKLFTTVLMRYLLDHAHSVDEAAEMLKKFDLHVPAGNGNYHYYMADATGRHAVVEYIYDEEHRSAEFIDDEIYDEQGKEMGNKYPTILPNTLEILYDYPCVSNFYVSPSMECSEKGPTKSQHGKTRYDIMDFVIKQNGNCLTEERAMNLLDDVSQAENPTKVTSHTQWSVVYNLSQRKATVCVNRDFDRKFTFQLK